MVGGLVDEPTYGPADDVVPAFPQRAAQRVERTDREILIDIQERMVRMEGVFQIGNQVMTAMGEAVKREGLVGIARVIPEMVRLLNDMRKADDGGS
jgi:hypothetical protein